MHHLIHCLLPAACCSKAVGSRQQAQEEDASSHSLRTAYCLLPAACCSKEPAMSRQIVYRGRKIQVAVESSVSANGQSIQRDVVIHPGAVAILPLVDRE